MMRNLSLWLLLLGLALTSVAAGPGSCVARCGEVFARGQQCTCDFSCLQFNECCPDFEVTCADATASVPQPGTLEPLRAAASGNQKPKKSKKKINSESEEQMTVLKASRTSTLQDVIQPTGVSVMDAGPEGPGAGLRDISAGLPQSILPSHGGSPDSPAPAHDLPGYGARSQGSRTPVGPSVNGSVAGTVSGHLVLSPGLLVPFGSSQGVAGASFQSRAQQDIAQPGLPVVAAGSEGPASGLFVDIHICVDSPINGLTALGNGSILVFKGELFWSVDPVSRTAGPPQSITDTLGVPSPIDSVFTRWTCNHDTNTYIIKGDQYWRLDGNMVVEVGYPKPLASEFPGLTGTISAALVVPATRSKPETVYFFRNGDIMQSFTFPSCNTKARSSMKRGLTRQAARLSGEINIKVSLKGFPSPVTSALTMPSPQRSDRFYHYVFSGPIFFRVKIVGDLPALAKPDSSAPLAPPPILSPATTKTGSAKLAAQRVDPTPPPNSLRAWLRCP